MAWNISTAKRRALVKLQLRDRKGRWIKMGNLAKWFSSEHKKEMSGKVVGGDGKYAIVSINGDKQRVKVPANKLDAIDSKATLPGKGEDSSAPSSPLGSSDATPEVPQSNAEGIKDGLDDIEAAVNEADTQRLKGDALKQHLEDAQFDLTDDKGDKYTISAGKDENGDWNYLTTGPDGSAREPHLIGGKEDNLTIAKKIEADISGEEVKATTSPIQNGSSPKSKWLDDGKYNDNGLTEQEQKQLDFLKKKLDHQTKKGQLDQAEDTGIKVEDLENKGKKRIQDAKVTDTVSPENKEGKQPAKAIIPEAEKPKENPLAKTLTGLPKGITAKSTDQVTSLTKNDKGEWEAKGGTKFSSEKLADLIEKDKANKIGWSFEKNEQKSPLFEALSQEDWDNINAEGTDPYKKNSTTEFPGFNEFQASAIHSYSVNSDDINSDARAGKSVSRYVAAQIASLDSMINQSTVKKDMTVYRGMAARPKYIQDILGGALSDNGFMSTTKKKSVADSWNSYKPHKDGKSHVQFEITLPKGFTAHDLDYKVAWENRKEEQEVLLPRGTTLDITDVEKYTDKYGNDAYRVKATPVLTSKNFKGDLNDVRANKPEQRGKVQLDGGSSPASEPGGTKEPSGDGGTASPAQPEVQQQVAKKAPNAVPPKAPQLAQNQPKKSTDPSEPIFGWDVPPYPEEGSPVQKISDGTFIEVGSKVFHPKMGFGTVVGWSNKQPLVLYNPRDTEFGVIQHSRQNKLSKYDPKKQVTNASSAELPVGAKGNDPRTGEQYQVGSNGKAIYEGDRVTVEHQGQSKEGIVKGLYNSGELAVTFDGDNKPTKVSAKKTESHNEKDVKSDLSKTEQSKGEGPLNDNGLNPKEQKDLDTLEETLKAAYAGKNNTNMYDLEKAIANAYQVGAERLNKPAPKTTDSKNGYAPRQKTDPSLPYKNIITSDGVPVAIGDTVTHPKFGEGMVVKTNNKSAVVRYSDGSMRTAQPHMLASGKVHGTDPNETHEPGFVGTNKEDGRRFISGGNNQPLYLDDKVKISYNGKEYDATISAIYPSYKDVSVFIPELKKTVTKSAFDTYKETPQGKLPTIPSVDKVKTPVSTTKKNISEPVAPKPSVTAANGTKITQGEFIVHPKYGKVKVAKVFPKSGKVLFYQDKSTTKNFTGKPIQGTISANDVKRVPTSVPDAQGNILRKGDIIKHPTLGEVEITGHSPSSGAVYFLDPKTGKRRQVSGKKINTGTPQETVEAPTNDSTAPEPTPTVAASAYEFNPGPSRLFKRDGTIILERVNGQWVDFSGKLDYTVTVKESFMEDFDLGFNDYKEYHVTQ